MKSKVIIEPTMSREEFETALAELNAELGEETGDSRTDFIVADDCAAIPGKYLADYLYNPMLGKIETSYEILCSKFPYMTAHEIKLRLKQEILEEVLQSGRYTAGEQKL